jgi:starvation-inducible outer membrane lipoprotein
MAKFELKFIDAYGFHFIEVHKQTIELYTKNEDVIYISIGDWNKEKSDMFIRLDKSTAIKFAKTLRTEINKITEGEVSNG